jgi:hypothetical protein
MATFYQDIIEYLTDYIDDYANLDSTALDVIIYDFLMTKENGYAEEYFEFYDDDSTAFVTILIDTTSPTITVLEWKEIYLEEAFNQTLTQNGLAAISSGSSPNYPLIDFRGKLYDFDADTSIDYPISAGEDSTDFIKYGFDNSVPIDGVMIQGGENGVQSYFAVGDWCLIAYYCAYSNNGIDWTYIYNSSGPPAESGGTIVDQTFVAAYTTDESVAASNPFLYFKQSPLEDKAIDTTTFTGKGLESKYWKMIPVDLLPTLTTMGIHPGFTGYTASFSHVRFHQIKEHGDLLVTQTVPVDSINPTVARGDRFESTVAGIGVGNWVIVIDPFGPTSNGRDAVALNWTLYSSNSTSNITTWEFQYLDTNAIWTTLETGSNPAGQTGMYTDIYSEVEREALDAELAFRVRAHAVGSTNMTIKLVYTVIAVSDTNSV